jgi:hypothetical protein
MKNILKIKFLWAFIGFVTLMIVLYNIGESQRRTREEAAKLIPKKPLGQDNPESNVDKSTLQAAQTVQSGWGVSYHTTAPTPSPTPPPQSVQEPKESGSLILCDFQPTPTPSPTPQRAEPADSWLPVGVYVPCVLQGSLESSHMDTPVERVINENVYQRDYGKEHLIIPAGSRVFSFATPGYTKDRIQVKGDWRLIFVNDGTEVTFQGIACDMEYDAASNHYGLEDKTAGIQGKTILSDHWIVVKNLLGLLLTTASSGASQVASSLLQSTSGSNVLNFQVPSASPVIDPYVQKIINPTGTQLSDVLFVRIPAGKPFWVVTTSIIEPELRSKGARLQASQESQKNPLPDSAVAMLHPDNAKKLLDQLQQKDPSNAPDTVQDSAAHFSK